MTPFLIIAAPRSRTFWTSVLLGCDHDPSRHWAGFDYGTFFAAGRSGIDTAVMMEFESVADRLKRDGVRVATLRRHPAEIAESLVKIGFAQNRVAPAARLGCARLDLLEATYGLPRFSSDVALRYREADRLYRWCFGDTLDHDRWQAVAAQHLESPYVRSDAVAA